VADGRRLAIARQLDILVAYVTAGGSIPDAAALVGIRSSTAKRHLADLRAQSGLSTEQLIYIGATDRWLHVPGLEPSQLTDLPRVGLLPSASPALTATPRRRDVLAACVTAGGSVPDAAAGKP
jgi:hypothetical protein